MWGHLTSGLHISGPLHVHGRKQLQWSLGLGSGAWKAEPFQHPDWLLWEGIWGALLVRGDLEGEQCQR